MGLLSKSARFLGGALKSAAKETIVYSRGDDVSSLTEAIPGRRENALDAIDAEQTSTREFDWIIAADELLIDGLGKVEPAPGDLIAWTGEDSIARTYRVVATNGDRCFRPMDQLGILFRVHTVLVEATQVSP